MVVVCDDTGTGRWALEVARHLADADARSLTGLLIAADHEGVERVRREAPQLIGERRAQYRQVVDPTVGPLPTTVRSQNAAVLALPASKPVLEASAFKILREGLSCPALLVR